MVYNNGIELTPLEQFRFPSVLGKIGAIIHFCQYYFFICRQTCTRFLVCRPADFFTGLLLKFTSAPGFPAGDLTEPGNFMSYFDRTVLPGRLSRKIQDTVGLLNLITGTCTILAGIITGIYLRNNPESPAKKVLWFLIAGTGFTGLSLLWNIDFTHQQKFMVELVCSADYGIEPLYCLRYFIL
jgi:predicted acyltransferase